MKTTTMKLVTMISLTTAMACGSGDASTARGNLSAGDACNASIECATGLECEIEHGASLCKPHGGSGADDGASPSPSPSASPSPSPSASPSPSPSASPSPSPSASPSPTGDCQTDTDCPSGEECELEHGSSFCKPHGGDNS